MTNSPIDPAFRAQLPDVDRAKAHLEDLTNQLERMRKEAPELTRRAAAVSATETSSDGLISVTVGPRGELQRLDLDPRIYRRPNSRQLADDIVEVIHRATSAAQDQVMDVFEPIMGREQVQMHLTGDIDAIVDDLNKSFRDRGI